MFATTAGGDAGRYVGPFKWYNFMPMTDSGKSEDALIAWIRSRAKANATVPIGIGDDMAMVRGSGELLVTSDMLMDGVDFDAARHTPEQIGRKTLAVSLSDCAAMAVRPRWAMVSVALPNAWGMGQAQRLYEGIQRLAGEFEVAIIGGDTNSWDQPLVVDVTVIAEPWPGIRPVTRSGMKPNDCVVVTGDLGGSLAGHHLDFVPRVHEAKRLAEKLGDGLHAMIDLSDGLSTDAHRMAAASGCGIELSGTICEQIASKAAIEMANQDQRSIADHVLNDGEDFELLLAVDPRAWMDYCERQKKSGEDTYRLIGTAIREPGVWMLQPDQTRIPVKPGGWQHFK